MPRRNIGEYAWPLLVAAFVVSAAGAAAVGASGGGSHVESAARVGSCTTITEPGHYVLANDIERDGGEEPCLVIDSDGVTLDGRNHSVVRRDASTPAVRITGVNVTVRDVVVTGGVAYSTGEGSTSRVSASGGELFVDARRKTVGGGTVVEKTVRVSDVPGGSPTGDTSDAASVSVSSSSRSVQSDGRASSVDLTVSTGSPVNVSSAGFDEWPFDDGTYPSVCGFGRTDAREE